MVKLGRRLISVLAAGILVGGCGVPTLGPTPSAKEVLAKPQQSNLKDAHFIVSGKITDNGVTLKLVGEGALVYKPKPEGHFKFQTTVGAQTVTFEEITIDGTNYGLTPSSPKWVATKSSGGFDPTAFAGDSEEKYIGEENLSQGKAWHASAKDKSGNAFDAYIRESDGYPIKYVESQAGGQDITITFDRYNAGDTVAAPPPDQIQAG